MVGKQVADVQLTYPMHVDTSERLRISLSMQIAKPDLDNDGYIQYFEAAGLSYSVQHEDTSIRDKATMWSREMTRKLLKYDSSLLDVNLETFESIEQELETAIFEVVPLFTFTFVILGSFAFASLLMTDWVRGKPFIASAGMIAACLGSASGMGLLILCGAPFTTAVGAVPFLIIGIGMDDMYILVAAWRGTSYRLPVEERTGEMLRHSAVSITITSITDALAFGIGCLTPFRSVQLFCSYTMVGVIFCYFYQLSFTVACIVFSGNAEKDNKHCITFRTIHPKNQANDKSSSYKFCCTGGHDDTGKPEEENKLCSSGPAIKLPYLNEFLGTKFAVFILKTPSKIAIILIYGLYLGFAIYGCTMMKEGLDRGNLVPDTSYYVKYFKDNNKYFANTYGPTVMFIYDEPLNYTKESVRKEIRYNRETFKRDKYFFDSKYSVVSWLDDYEYYYSQRYPFSDFNDMTEEEFVRTLREEFLTYPGLDFYTSDIQFNKANTTIVSSRIYFQSKGPKDAVEERDIMLNSREIAENCKYKAYAFHLAFTYFDQYTIILDNTLQNLGIATASMLIVALIFIPSLSTVLWVTVTTVSIEIGVVGYMVFWDVNLDSISMINLIMCIGFSVDFAAHISYHYTVSESLSPLKSAQEALGQLGAPILQSAVSTILGVAVLSLSVSYIFRTFFKIVTMVMIFGSFHALFLLPVVLSTIKGMKGVREYVVENEFASQTDKIIVRKQNGVDRKQLQVANSIEGDDFDYKVEIYLK